MFFVDSHCHPLFSHFKKALNNCSDDFCEKYNTDAVIQRAINANVKYMLAIGTELSDAAELKSVTDKYPRVFRTVGIHPLEAEKHCQSYTKEEICRIIKDNCKDEKTIGIGEIGLDYHYGKENVKQQKELFELQLEIAKECSLPVSIHSREAQADTINILKNHLPVTGVIHCFSGEKDFAEKVLDLGFYISISGIITYKNAIELQNSLKYIPLDRMLIETDCPFLSPAPFRGKLNEPAFVIHVAKKISELLAISLEKTEDFSSQNFFELFKIWAA